MSHVYIYIQSDFQGIQSKHLCRIYALYRLRYNVKKAKSVREHTRMAWHSKRVNSELWLQLS